MIRLIKMNFIQAKSADFELLQQFIESHESTCVSLCSYIRKKDEHIYILTNRTKINSADDIKGVILLDNLLLHCIPNVTTEILETFTVFIADKKLKAIEGQKDVSLALIDSISNIKKPYQINSYKLMELSKIALNPPETLSCDDEIIRCTENDLDNLYELQKQYLIKEVAPLGKEVTDLEVRLSLKQILKYQLAFALYADGEIVAKANTNAIGFNYVQIGGVFTHPLFRKNYYAWNLIKTLCDRIQKTQKKTCLFVKDKNYPALKLYEQIGFEETDSFVIAYF